MSNAGGQDGEDKTSHHHRGSNQELHGPRAAEPEHHRDRVASRRKAERQHVERDVLDILNFAAVLGAFIAAGLAAFEADRLANLTHDTERDAQSAAVTAHLDNVNALRAADADLAASNASSAIQQAGTDRALRIAAQANRIAEVAGTREGAALQGQLEQMRRQGQIGLDQLAPRLMLRFEPQPPGRSADGQDGWPTTITWKNMGQTDAVNITAWSRWRLFTESEAATFDFMHDPKEAERNTFPKDNLVPNDVLTQGVPFVTVDDMPKIVSGEGEFVMWGYIEYTERLSGRIHHVHFCNTERVISNTPDGSRIVVFPLYKSECNTSD